MRKIYALSFWWKFSISLFAPLSLHAPGLENRLINEIEQNKRILENNKKIYIQDYYKKDLFDYKHHYLDLDSVFMKQNSFNQNR